MNCLSSTAPKPWWRHPSGLVDCNSVCFFLLTELFESSWMSHRVASKLPHLFALSKLELMQECWNACWLDFLNVVKIRSVVKLLLVFNWYWHLNAEAKDFLTLAVWIGLMSLLLQSRMTHGDECTEKKHMVGMNSALCLPSLFLGGRCLVVRDVRAAASWQRGSSCGVPGGVYPTLARCLVWHLPAKTSSFVFLCCAPLPSWLCPLPSHRVN